MNKINSLKIQNSEIFYTNYLVTKIILCGIIVSHREGLSPQKKPILILKIRDSTGLCSVVLYDSPFWKDIEKFQKEKCYVKISGEVKCQGTYRF